MYWCRWLLPLVCFVAYAQDPFEIQVFEYEPLPLGSFTYEEHLNYVTIGGTQFDGSAAPLQGQFHASSEWTAGITDEIRAGFVILTAFVPGYGMQYAGVRMLPHFYAPKSWGLPVNLGFVAEFSFEKPLFDSDARQLELRGIIEKHIGRLQLDSNFVLHRSLEGPGAVRGWGVEPSARVGWQQWRTLTPSGEYYSSASERIRLIVPGADWKIGDRLTWSFGIGIGTASGSREIVLKSRLEYEFGRNHD